MIAWVRLMPSHLRPGQVGKLEAIRRRYRASHEDFAMFIAGHRFTPRNLQRALFAQLRRERPSAPIRELLVALACERRRATWANGYQFFGLSSDAGEEAGQDVDALLGSSCEDVDSLAEAFQRDMADGDVLGNAAGELTAREVERVLDADRICLRRPWSVPWALLLGVGVGLLPVGGFGWTGSEIAGATLSVVWGVLNPGVLALLFGAAGLGKIAGAGQPGHGASLFVLALHPLLNGAVYAAVWHLVTRAREGSQQAGILVGAGLVAWVAFVVFVLRGAP